jgi:Ankyrin repeats (many copies)
MSHVGVTKFRGWRVCEDRGVELMTFFRAIAARDSRRVAELLGSDAGLATSPIPTAATREDPKTYFFDEIRHYVYAGDTALHVAAAAFQLEIARSVIAMGADPRARNRRGAQPLHYAADGSPGAAHWDPDAQHDVIQYLIEVGADPNALDKSGVAPLHRAVRTRSAAAVRALIDNGADPLLENKNGSTPMDLAVQNTGRSGSGSDEAKEQQAEIIEILTQWHDPRPAHLR